MNIFDSPYDAADPRNGQEVRILRTFTVPSMAAGAEPLTQHAVRFPDGVEENVWPEELRGES